MNRDIQKKIEQIDSLYDQAVKEYSNHNYTGSISLLIKVFQKYNLLVKQDYVSLKLPYIANLQKNIGIINLKLNNFDQGQKWFLEELETRKKIHNNKPQEDTANALGHIGLTLERMGKYTESIDYYSQKLKMLNKLYTEPNAAIAATHRSIGIGYFYRGQDDGAKYAKQNHLDSSPQCFTKSTKSQEKLYSVDDDEFAFKSLTSIGKSYKALQKYEDSAKYYDSALLMNLRLYEQKPTYTHSEEENLSLYRSVFELVSVYKLLHNESEAMYRMIQTIELLERHNNKPSLVMATLAKDIGDVSSILVDKGVSDCYEYGMKYYDQSSAILGQYINEHATYATLINITAIEQDEETGSNELMDGVVRLDTIRLPGQSNNYVEETSELV